MAYAIQRGLATGANEVFTFGLFEGAIATFTAISPAPLKELDAPRRRRRDA